MKKLPPPMSPMRNKGLLITFEGGEGAGKTTLIEKIHAYLTLQNYPVCKTREPGGTKVGAQIRHLILHNEEACLSKRCELLLFLADRAQHVDTLIKPALEQGHIVLCDRFNDSTLAYQGAARGLKAEVVRKLCQFSCNKIKVNLTLYLDIDPKIGLIRAKNASNTTDKIESETLQFHQDIRKAFKQIARKEPKRVKIIDASKTPQEVYTLAKEKIDALLRSNRQ